MKWGAIIEKERVSKKCFFVSIIIFIFIINVYTVKATSKTDCDENLAILVNIGEEKLGMELIDQNT